MNAADHDPLDSFEARVRRDGADKAVADYCAAPGTLAARKKRAMFFGAFRGHDIGPERFVEQPFGFVATCARCEMIVRVPRDREVVEGRAVEFDCPSGRR